MKFKNKILKINLKNIFFLNFINKTLLVKLNKKVNLVQKEEKSMKF